MVRTYKQAAQALAIGYDGYLRPSEALSLTAASVHVSTSRPNATAGRVAITICPFSDNSGYAPAKRTKSGEYDDSVVFGDAASTAANRGFVVELLIRLKSKHRLRQTIFDISIAEFEAALQFARRTL